MKRIKKLNKLYDVFSKVNDLIEKRKKFYKGFTINNLVEFYISNLEKSLIKQNKSLCERFKNSKLSLNIMGLIKYIIRATLLCFKKMKSLFPSKFIFN